MTATDTEAALLAAIRENPGEDAPRLVYADGLEENAGTVACGRCWSGWVMRTDGRMGADQCRDCHGEGRVSDGRKEWAEFIRVQCELATREPVAACLCESRELCGECVRTRRLSKRERELWPAVRGAFELEGVNLWRERCPGSNTATPAVLVRRGLPSVVRCTLAEWMGGECGQCQGRGQRTLYGDGSGPWTKCQYCIDGRTPGIGPRLAQRWPIVAVEVADDPLHLPSEITNRFPPGQYTPAKFRAALSDALIAWARSQPIGEGRS